MNAAALALAVLVVIIALVVVIVALVILYRVIEAQRVDARDANDDRQAEREVIARERALLLRALIANTAPEFAMLDRTSQAAELADANARILATLDPRNDLEDLRDPITGERPVLVGMTGAMDG